MKLTELKAKVYDIAEVTTTKQLKAQHIEIQALDMRYKTSWEKALTLLGQSTITDPEKKEPNFENWLSNPPEEYKTLFAKADTVLGTFSKKLDKAKRSIKAGQAMAASLDEFAEANAAEAHHLAQAAARAHDLSKQADLN